jgi:hypothetical protein
MNLLSGTYERKNIPTKRQIFKLKTPQNLQYIGMYNPVKLTSPLVVEGYSRTNST